MAESVGRWVSSVNKVWVMVSSVRFSVDNSN